MRREFAVAVLAMAVAGCMDAAAPVETDEQALSAPVVLATNEVQPTDLVTD
jgi:PBP1b-binding outer membrane lipoprotein LpoB